MRVFVKFPSFLNISFENIYFKPRKVKCKIEHCYIFLERIFSSLFSTSSTTFSKFDAVITILFQIKVFRGNINGTTLAMYLIKITAHSSFTRIRFIMQINGIHLMLKQKTCYKDSVLSPFHIKSTFTRGKTHIFWR